MANMSAKFYEEAHNGLVCIVFTSLFLYVSIVTLTFDLNRVNPLVIVNMSERQRHYIPSAKRCAGIKM